MSRRGASSPSRGIAGWLPPLPERDAKMVEVVKEAVNKGAAATRKKEKKRREEETKQCGVDDGTSAQKLLMRYVDQVLEQVQSPDARVIPEHVTTNKTFKEMSFLEKLQHPDMVDVPLHSQITRQKAMVPHHESAKMNLFIGVCSSLKRNDGGMVRLRLSNEMIDDKVAKMLATAVTNNVYLQHLMLHDNVITDIGAEALCLALRWHPSIQTIWMAGNLISDRGAIALATLAGRNPNVIDLNLANKRPRKSWGESQDIVHPEFTYIGAESFAKQLMRGCGLTSLSLAEHKIRDIGARMLFKALSSSKLRNLNLKSTGITANCCLSLRNALLEQPVLEKLVLAKNEIGDDGVQEICAGLAQNTVLQALDLSKCQIQETGLNALLLCLETNFTLSALNTMYNLSPDDRADRIVDMRSAATRALDQHLDRLGKDADPDSESAPLSARTMDTLQHLAEDSFKLRGSSSGASGGNISGAGGANLDLSAIAMPRRAKDILLRSASRGESRGESRGASRGASRGSVRRSSSRSMLGSASSPRSVSPRSVSPRMRSDSVSFQQQPEKEGGSPEHASTWSRGSSRQGARGRMGSRGGSDLPPSRGLDLTTGWKESARIKSPSVANVTVGGMRPRSRPLRSEVEQGDAAAAAAFAAANAAAAGGSRSGSRARSRSRSQSRVGDMMLLSSRESPSPRRSPGTSPSGSPTGSPRSSPRSRSPSLTGRERALSNISDTSGQGGEGIVGGGNGNGNNMEAFMELFESESEDMRASSASRKSRPEYVITERMRLGHQLPNSPYRRYFEDKDRPVLSRELGMTRNVPKIGNVGVMPVRNTVTRFKDSAQHLTYLRVATPDDPPDARPISLIQIALDQKAFADKVRAERQTPLYKELKRDAMDFVPRGKQRLAAKKIPADFWEKWKKKMRQRYPRGIDKAPKIRSTDLKEFKRPTKVLPSGKIVLDKIKAAVKTPGDALVYRREKRLEEIQKEKEIFYGGSASVTIAHAKKLTHDILGLRADQPLSDIYTDRNDGKYRKGLTKRVGADEEPVSFTSKAFKAY